jgi:hypothetical protein
MKNKFLPISTFLMIFLIGLFGCSVDQSNQSYNFKLSITDAPAADNFKEAWIDFDRIEVSKALEDGEEEDGWIVVNSDGGEVNLLELTNGRLHDLVVVNLESGQYNQIRFYVSRTWVVVDESGDDVEYEVHLASNTIKFVF